MNPGITLDQFALAVELEDNYQTDSYDLEYPGLIMTIRLNTVTITVDHHHYNCDHDLEQMTIWLYFDLNMDRLAEKKTQTKTQKKQKNKTI